MTDNQDLSKPHSSEAKASDLASGETKASDRQVESPHRKNWQWKSNELKKALDDWEHLTEEVHGPSPDEQILQDMQKLIKEIKTKLNQFQE